MYKIQYNDNSRKITLIYYICIILKCSNERIFITGNTYFQYV